MKLFLGSARTALKIILSEIKFDSNEILLLPNFICDVVLHPINDLKIKYLYYNIKENLEPDWDNLFLLISNDKNIKAILIVHYFGNPFFLDKYLEISESCNIEMIEDNAHGYGGYYGGKEIGTFGKWGISSPRKILNLPSGGILYSSTEVSSFFKLTHFGIFNLKEISKIVLFIFPYLYRIIKPFISKYIQHGNEGLTMSRVERDRKIDIISKFIIDRTDWSSVQRKRSENWDLWTDFALKNGLRLVYEELHAGSSPWMLPVYAKNLHDRNNWLNWGIKYKINFTSWPNLPVDVLLEGEVAYTIWERLICIPLDTKPPKYYIK